MTRNREFRAGEGRLSKRKTVGLDASRFLMETLNFLAANPDQAARFFDWSGLDAAGLRAAAADPGFVIGLLDYFAQNLVALERFCETVEIDPGAVLGLHEALRVRGLTSHDDP